MGNYRVRSEYSFEVCLSVIRFGPDVILQKIKNKNFFIELLALQEWY